MSRAGEIYPLESMRRRELKLASEDRFNSEPILKYYHYRVAEGLSLARICKCLNTVRQISKMLGKPFAKATKDDFVTLVSNLELSDRSDWTKRDYKVVLKQFYKWFRNWEEGHPPEVRWIKKAHKVERKFPILPQDLLTANEKAAMLNATQNPRDRALIEIYFESGRRLGEVLTVHVGDVEFDSLGAKLFVNGKVGEDFIRVISSRASLATWMNCHPLRDDKHAPLWIGLGYANSMKQIRYSAARAIVKKVARRAGIKKRVFNYLFRYTRIDETQGRLTEDQQCVMFGWQFGSRMPKIYKRRYGKHIDNAQAVMNGTAPLVLEKPLLAFRKCPRCTVDNSPVSKFCHKCGCPLDSDVAVQTEDALRKANEVLDRLAKDPEKLDKLLALVKS